MVFPVTPLDARTELLIGGTWTAITPVQGTDSIPVTRGHPDESTTTSPSSAGPLTLPDNDGRYSLRNPTGIYYPNLVRNVPLRVSVPSRSVYLRLEDDTGTSYAACPDSAGVSVTGDLDLRLDLALSGWQECVLAAKWTPGGGTQSSWLLALEDDGTLAFFWSTTGADALDARSTMPLPLRRGALRITLDVNNGAGGNTVTFFTGAAGGADGPAWTQLGAAVTQAGTTSVFDSTTAVSAGAYTVTTNQPALGAVFELELRNGIAGTVVAHPVFSSQTAGAASFADAQGNTWTLHGLAELSGRSYRAHAEATGWPLFTDPSGIDITVQLSANGVLRRISQGQTPVASPMYRAFTRIGGTLAPVAYWPCEDGTGATSLASGIGGPPMVINGPVQLAQDSSFAGSLPLPVMNGGSFYGKIPPYVSNGSLICRFLLNVAAAPPDGARLLRLVTTGTCRELSCYYGTGGKLGIAGFNDGGAVFDSGEFAFAVNNQPVWVSMELRPGGGPTVNWSIETLIPGATGSVGTSGTFTGTIGNGTEAYPGATQQLGQVTVGQVSVQSDWESLFDLAGPLAAWQGEAAGTRFARLCGEESLACRIYGPPAVTVPMGIQTQQTISSLLQECADADVGIMYEPSECLGLGYRTQASLLNQAAALTIAYNQLAQGLQPTQDDQTIINDVTVTQSGDGSSARQFDDNSSLSVLAPPDGVGTYDTQQQVNVADDSQLNDQAGWRLHLGTVDEPRYPAVTIDLATTDAGITALFFSVLEVRLGDRIVITSPPAWLPPGSIDQLVQGVTEHIYDKVLNLVFACVPQSPYQTAVLDDVVLGRCDTDGSTLAAAAAAGAVLLQVATTDPAAPVWTSTPADFPFDIAIAGERITATAAGPPGSWLTGQNSGFEGGIGTWVSNANCTVAPSPAAAHSGSGSLQMTSVAAGSMSAVSVSAGTQGMPVTPGDTVNVSAWFLAAAAARSCVVGAQFFTAAGGFVSTLTGSGITDSTTGWTQATASLTPVPATAAFARAYAQVTGTGAAAEVHLVDDVMLGDTAVIPAGAQLLVVTRAVNGISKAHLAGEDVRLWTPPILTQI